MSLETINVETWVVLWSPHQKAYHVETVGEMITRNRENWATRTMADFVVLSFATSHKEANAIANKYDKLVPRTGFPPEAEPVGAISKRLFDTFNTEETEE